MHLPPDSPQAPRTPLQFLWTELRIGVPLCVGVAAFLSVLFGDSFGNMLVYSLCIGTLIQWSIEGGRYAMAAWLRRREPDRASLVSDWPGWTLMAPWVVISSIGGYWAGSHLGDLITGNTRTHGIFTGNPRVLAVILLVTLVASVGTTFFFYSRGRMATIEAMAEAARRTSVETQLKLLQSQLEPHMLFNTLANLRVLIGLDPARAQAMLDHLIGFLRATLNASRSDRHPLSAEFDRVADYLALMAIRMGPRLQVVLDLPDDLRTLPVPPLLLQPLVENCIHHGLEPKVAGGRIELSARRDGPLLRLAVRDTGVGLAAAPASAGTGFGTAQVRERLATLFGDRAGLTLQPADGPDGGTLATVTLPLPLPNVPA
ncbi:sensor histidine kinase [Ideonella sp. A 288]|uniref:sensor histidine kinase n=1 Tax=Ideonella sp. A 288 TaxID=1962181 RepID=UPI000B4B3201|nr:histidine kinase [Ideonella sp. A 288]